MTQAAHADSREKIKVLASRVVDERHAVTADELYLRPAEGVHYI